MTLSRIRASNPDFRDAQLIGAEIRVRSGMAIPIRGPMGFLEELMRPAGNQLEFDDGPDGELNGRV